MCECAPLAGVTVLGNLKGRQDGAWRRLSRPPRSWCARGQSPLALLSVGPWRLKAGQRCKALRGAGSSSGRPLHGGVPAEQVSTTSESEVEDEDKSSQSGDKRVHGETGHSNPCKVSRHSSATVLNAQVAEHDQPRGSPQESWGRRPWLLPSPLHENKLQGVE